MAGWTIRTDSGSRTFSKSAVSIPAGSKSDFTLPYSEGAVTLTSPDGEIRSTATVVRKAPEPVATQAPASDTPKPVNVAPPVKDVELAKTATVEKPVAPKVSESATGTMAATPSENATPPPSETAAPQTPATADNVPASPEAVLAQAEKNV